MGERIDKALHAIEEANTGEDVNLHMIETLTPRSGCMGVLVPHGVLFQGSSEGKIRKELIDEVLLNTVSGLPEKLFYGTDIPAAILVFRKDRCDDKVLSIDASQEFVDGKNQNQLSDSNVAKVVRTYTDRETFDKYSYLATLEEIQENDDNLNIPRYVDTFEEEIDLMLVQAERKEVEAEIANLSQQMGGYLKELGYGA